jgi:hypothetical protein
VKGPPGIGDIFRRVFKIKHNRKPPNVPISCECNESAALDC